MPTNIEQIIADQVSTGQTTERDQLQKVYDVLKGGQYTGSDLQKTNLRAQEIAQNQYSQNLAQTQLTAMDAIRRANASAIASGANQGLAAAQQLSAILGLQQEATAGATDIASKFMQTESEEAKWLTGAQLSAIQRGGELTAAEAAQQSADAQIWEQMGIDSNTLLTNMIEKASVLTPEQATGEEGKALVYARRLLEMSQGAGSLQQKRELLELMTSLQGVPTAEQLAKAESIVGKLSNLQIEQALNSLKTKEAAAGILPTDPKDDTAAQAAQRKKEQEAQIAAASTYLTSAKAGEKPTEKDRVSGILNSVTAGWYTGDGQTFPTEWYDPFVGAVVKTGMTQNWQEMKIDGKSYGGGSAGVDATKAMAEKLQKQINDSIAKANSTTDPVKKLQYIEEAKHWQSEAEKFVNSIKTEQDACITGNTLIMMANGSQKQIKNIKAGEMVLTYTPAGNIAVPLYTSLKHPAYIKTVLRLHFSNGYVDTVDGHAFCLARPKKCVTIQLSNIQKYLGKEFMVGHNQYAILETYDTYETKEPLYSPMAHKYMWLYTNGILSTAHLTEFIVNARLKKYDPKKLIRFEQVPGKIRSNITRELFDAYDGEMLVYWAKGFKKFIIGKQIKKLIGLLDPK